MWICLAPNSTWSYLIDDEPNFVQVMAWHRTGDKLLPEPMIYSIHWCTSLQWRHNGRDGVSNHQRQKFVQAQIIENMKPPRHWPLWGEPLVTGGFPSQRASNAENVSIWWRHHDMPPRLLVIWSTKPQRVISFSCRPSSYSIHLCVCHMLFSSSCFR